MYNREAINILLWKAEMPCLNVWGVSQASQLCDRCHMSPELCTTSYCETPSAQFGGNGHETFILDRALQTISSINGTHNV